MSKPDLSEFEVLSNPRKAPCQIGVARDGLDTEEAVKLDAALDADKGQITAGAIQQWLKARGHAVSNPAVTSHRKGTCSCASD